MPSPAQRYHGTIAGARIAPTFAPELKMPVASERSPSETIRHGLDRGGKVARFAKSEKEPRKTKLQHVLASACPIAERLHTAITSM